MNDNARKWVAALRSGQYKQTTGVLSRGDKDCCLGVACKVFLHDNPLDLTVSQATRPGYSGVTMYDGAITGLPLKVQEWLGVPSPEGNFGEDDDECLSGRNDQGASFAQIADLIEQEPYGLFTDPPPVPS